VVRDGCRIPRWRRRGDQRAGARQPPKKRAILFRGR
jgi:hypothetical protein